MSPGLVPVVGNDAVVRILSARNADEVEKPIPARFSLWYSGILIEVDPAMKAYHPEGDMVTNTMSALIRGVAAKNRVPTKFTVSQETYDMLADYFKRFARVVL